MRGDPIVGRRAEIAVLRLALDDLDAGAGGCVALVGEAGIGKTRLARELRARAEERGRLVLEGRGTEFEQERPFGLAADALNAHLASLDPARLQRLGGERLAELGSVFPSLASLGGALASELPAERYRCHQAVRALLEQLATEGPLVLVLDDLHWADQASLELAAHLVRRRPDAPVLLVLAYRPRGASRVLAGAVAAAAREESVTQIELSPLDGRDSEELLGPGLDPATRSTIRRDSGGNPLYLSELARAARGDREELPPSVSAAIVDEAGAASPTGRTVLRAAAVAGEPFDPALAARVAAIDETSALGAIDELLELDLLRAAPAPGRFLFRHPVVRHAVYESQDAAWRREAHARAARALRARGAPSTERAHHLARSARVGDEEAIGLLSEAGQAAVARAPATAAGWLATALRILPVRAGVERRLSLLIPLAVSLGAVGRVEASRAALAEALQLMPEDLPVIRGQVIAAAARLDHLLGRHGAARRLLSASLDQLRDQRSRGATALKLELAVDHWLAGEWEAMTRCSDEALTAARQLGDRPLHAHAAALLAVGELHRGTIRRGAERIGEAARIVDRASDDELAYRIEALLTLGLAECGVERFEAAADHLARGIAISRATGQGAWLEHLVNLGGVARLLLGELGEASALVEATEESALLGPDPPLVWGLTLRCWLSLLEGDLAAALATGERSRAIRQRLPATFYYWLAGCTHAAARIEAGQPKLGRDEILREGAGEALTAIEPSWRPYWWAVLAHAELALDRVEAAERWVERAEAGAEALGLTGQIGDAGRARAAVSLARGDAVGAAEQAADAASRLEEVGRRIDAARARTLAGRALAEAGRRQSAAGELDRARSQLAACGATRYRDEAARELRRLGHRVRPAERLVPRGNHLAGLSEGERELSRLVARGLTNREIAAEVFVSEKTIERRLSRVFRRLGLSSRSELAAMAERERSRI